MGILNKNELKMILSIKQINLNNLEKRKPCENQFLIESSGGVKVSEKSYEESVITGIHKLIWHFTLRVSIDYKIRLAIDYSWLEKQLNWLQK